MERVIASLRRNIGLEPCRGFEDRDQHACDRTGLVANGAVTKSEVGVLQVAVTGNREKLISQSDRLTLPDALVDRLVDVPDLGPALPGGLRLGLCPLADARGRAERDPQRGLR